VQDNAFDSDGLIELVARRCKQRLLNRFVGEGTDVDVQKKLLIGVAQQIGGACGVSCFPRENTLCIVIVDFVEAIQLAEVQIFE
jgi:hypothetical protein